MILEIPWLRRYNLIINDKKGIIKFERYNYIVRAYFICLKSLIINKK